MPPPQPNLPPMQIHHGGAPGYVAGPDPRLATQPPVLGGLQAHCCGSKPAAGATASNWATEALRSHPEFGFVPTYVSAGIPVMQSLKPSMYHSGFEGSVPLSIFKSALRLPSSAWAMVKKKVPSVQYPGVTSDHWQPTGPVERLRMKVPLRETHEMHAPFLMPASINWYCCGTPPGQPQSLQLEYVVDMAKPQVNDA